MKIHLSLQNRLILAFLGMSLLVVIASSAGFFFSISVQKVGSSTLRSLNQIQSLVEAQRGWQAVSGSLDRLFLARQVDESEAMLDQDLEAFNSRISGLQTEQWDSDPASTANNQVILDELSLLSSGMTDTVLEIARLAGESRWAVARDLRETVLATQQSDFNEQLNQLRKNIQAGIQTSLDNAIQAQDLTRTITILAAVVALLMAIGLGILTTRAIIQPVRELVGVVQRVTLRDFSPVTPLKQQDEIGNLSRSIALMTEWLRESYESLEDHVAERTQELERQKGQIQAAAEIARDVTSSHDLDELLNRSVELINQRFGFYHAGIFLLDAANEYAELHAATGPTSQEMLSLHHKLKVGETGIVGYVAETGQPRVALDVGEDAVHFQNPLLPETRSEIALPLKVGDLVIGILDVQSQQPSAFKDDDINVLQILADLLAVAIDNTRLYQEVQANLNELETLYGQDSQRGWRKIIQSGSVIGFQYDQMGIHPIYTDDSLLLQQENPVLNIPLVVRGEEIGTLCISPGNKDLPADDLTLLEDLGVRISQSLDSARLFTEAQRRAENEKLISQATSRMLETLDIETVLKTAAEDIYQVLGLSNLTIDLSPREIL